MTDTTPSRAERAAGILLHPTSIPGPHGVGDLGAAAYRFVDFLTGGQLPLCVELRLRRLAAADLARRTGRARLAR